MYISLPFKYNEKSMNISDLEIVNYPYIVSTNGAKIMTKEEIILRLESALDNKDWADIELLLDDLQIEEVSTDQGYDQFVDDDWNLGEWKKSTNLKCLISQYPRPGFTKRKRKNQDNRKKSN